MGRTVITPAAAAEIPPEEVLRALDKHGRGEWGNLDEADLNENEFSLKNGFRLLSAYQTENGTKFWIITEADRSVTTILLPGDY